MSARASLSHVPAYVPQAQGRITHDVTYDLPKERGAAVLSDSMPVCSEAEGRQVATALRAKGMRNIKVVPR